MTPLDIHIKGGPPLIGTFNFVEREFAAGLLVLVCQLDGDAWRPVFPAEVGTVCKLHIDEGIVDDQGKRTAIISAPRRPLGLGYDLDSCEDIR
jgi:hypothetical protein